MNATDYKTLIEDTNAELRKSKSPVQTLRRVAKRLNRDWRHTNVAALWNGPHIKLGTGDFKGRRWDMPCAIHFVHRTCYSDDGVEHGHGLQLEDDHLTFTTELLVHYTDRDGTTPDFTDPAWAAEQLAEWHAQLMVPVPVPEPYVEPVPEPTPPDIPSQLGTSLWS